MNNYSAPCPFLSLSHKGMFIYLSVLASLMNLACRQDAGNRLQSDVLMGKEQRLEILREVIVFKSPVEDAVYDLFNVNGFSKSRSAIPGASSWNYRFGVKVALGTIPLWLTDMKPIVPEAIDTTWTKPLYIQIKDDVLWREIPRYYENGAKGSLAVVYPDSGWIFKQIVQD